MDDRPVQRTAQIRSTSASHTFDRDELDPDAHRHILLTLADELAIRLRTSGEVCRGLTLTVRYANRTSTTRSRALPEPTHHSPTLTALAYSLYTAPGSNGPAYAPRTARRPTRHPLTPNSFLSGQPSAIGIPHP
ncbi:hypothetical protein [Streptomyces sp. NPDC005507]|uniref:DinB/UmuC family translesion DNA polymerase n=1 Tax=Streptomyces sp. NPDC005507 TaxID=3154885 RepID=UPI0033A6A074